MFRRSWTHRNVPATEASSGLPPFVSGNGNELAIRCVLVHFVLRELPGFLGHVPGCSIPEVMVADDDEIEFRHVTSVDEVVAQADRGIVRLGHARFSHHFATRPDVWNLLPVPH